ncbi:MULTISPECIES: hypothetical protein [unclassified Aeromicrobium]|jgi:hypothetical protein|nr:MULTISPECIES: hypothetical protein [unclassified Aeromicrobium]
MQPVATLPQTQVVARPHAGWSVVSAIFVGAFVALDRLLERLGH